MFDGVPDQFHHFIASSRTSLPIPFPFPLHATTSPPPPPPPPPLTATFPTFDPYPSHQTLQPHHHHHQLHHPPPKNEPSSKEDQTTLLSTSLVLERERSAPDPPGPWSNEEVLALLRIRSSMENWFPDFSWEHVSRKLGELGFKRSAEKCKERFEEENRNLNNISSFNKNFRFFSELDELYQPGNQKNQNLTQNPPRRQDNTHQAQSLEEAGSGNVDHNNNNSNNNLEENEEVFMMQRSSTTSSKCNNDNKKSRSNKRKRKFEMFKGFCEAIVERIMAQQEELHNKIIEDMTKREEEKIARDEAWKSQEMDRLNKEIESREKEHEIASNRQAKIIEFLNKFASNSSQNQSLLKKLDDLFEVTSTTAPDSNPSATHCSTQLENELLSTKKSKKTSHHHHLQNPSPNNPTQPTTKNPILPSTSSTMDLAPQNPTLHESKDTQNEGGKRWPREEVLALINLRCSLNNNNNDNNSNKEGAKGPLWERISQGMQELGYKRSAKRCKEKWENINKYFRKTKDNNKKRSLDSRTCPYFHQLSTLYCSQQGKLREDSPENRSDN